MSDISLSHLSKRFGELLAVDDVSLDVEAGQVLCLLGPSGCGKTTTLRMVAGLESVTAGRIEVGGRRVEHLAPRDRDIAMVFQFYALYPSLTVRENVAFPLHAEGASAAEIAERVARVARILELEGLLGRKPRQLAEGELQRVAVARAIVREPTCFLFDEPLSRLDVQLRETMRGQIKEVLNGLRKATVIVTHDQLEALTMADNIAVMRDGRIEQVATAHGIFAAPANLFVAGFIGTPQMNFVPATVRGSAPAGTRFEIGARSLSLAVDPAVQALEAGAPVTLGVRPRALELTDREAGDTLPATVDVVEPMGAETLVHLADGERDLRIVVPRQRQPAPGANVHVRFVPGQTHVFDGDERRVGHE